jgi:Sec-independent protein secretion pathway component TatC
MNERLSVFIKLFLWTAVPFALPNILMVLIRSFKNLPLYSRNDKYYYSVIAVIVFLWVLSIHESFLDVIEMAKR